MWNLQPSFVICHNLVRSCTEGNGVAISSSACGRNVDPDSDTSTLATSRLCLAPCAVSLAVGAVYVLYPADAVRRQWHTWRDEAQRTFISFLMQEALPGLDECPELHVLYL
jgi:hypothetical protein